MRLAPFVVLVLLPTLAGAATFRTLQGETFEAQITGLYGDVLFLKSKLGTATMPVEQLDDTSLGIVADYMAKPAAQGNWASSASAVAKSLNKRLQFLDGDTLKPFDRGARSEPEFYLIYFSAHWCGPCQRFSPHLLEKYRQLKTFAGDRFELIFVSDDRDAREQLTYVRELKMPWPVLRYGVDVPVLEKWRGSGIPCLVAINRDGDLLFHSYAGSEYLGPDEPLQRFEALLRNTQSKPRPTASLHRLAVIQHLRSAAGGDASAKGYLISVDPKRNQTLPAGSVTAHALIDARGHVTEVSFAPQLEVIALDQLTREAEHWLFLPAVKAGRAVAATVDLPLIVGH